MATVNPALDELGTTEPLAVAEPHLFRRGLVSLWHDPVALISLLVVVALALVAILAPYFSPYNPNHIFLNGLSADGAPIHPDGTFLLGTDPNGRDVLSRLIYGDRVSLLVGVVATGLASVIGVIVGAIAGYVGGIVESILMRLTDVVLSFPILLFCIALITVTGPSTATSCSSSPSGTGPTWPGSCAASCSRSKSASSSPRPHPGRRPREDPEAPHPPAPRADDHRLLDARHRHLHPHRGVTFLPRHRRARPGGVLGPDDLPGQQYFQIGALAPDSSRHRRSSSPCWRSTWPVTG